MRKRECNKAEKQLSYWSSELILVEWLTVVNANDKLTIPYLYPRKNESIETDLRKKMLIPLPGTVILTCKIAENAFGTILL